MDGTQSTESLNTLTEGKDADKINALLAMPEPPIVLTEKKFSFRKNEIGEKRPAVALNIPTLTFDGVIAALKDAKQRELVLDLVNEAIYDQVREQLNDESNPVNSQAQLDLSKLTFDFIANMPKAERRGGGISKEIWEKFGQDYAAVMLPLTGRTQDQINTAVKLLLAKFQPVKTNKPLISKLKEYIDMWFSKTTNAEEFAECYEFLGKKAESLLAADEKELLNNI